MADVLILMGSQSDAATMKHTRDVLDELGILIGCQLLHGARESTVSR